MVQVFYIIQAGSHPDRLSGNLVSLMECSKYTVACLLIDSVPVSSEISRYPALRGKPIVIVENRGPMDLVLDSFPEAKGVSQGMTIEGVLDILRGAVIMQADDWHYRDTSDRILDGLKMRFSAVDRAGLGCAYVPIDGLSSTPSAEAQLIVSLLRAAPTGFSPRVGLGTDRIIAYAAAATAPKSRAKKAPADSDAFLNTCPVDLLPLVPDQRARLLHAGIRTLLDLVRKPQAVLLPIFASGSGMSWEFANASGLIGPSSASHVAA